MYNVENFKLDNCLEDILETLEGQGRDIPVVIVSDGKRHRLLNGCGVQDTAYILTAVTENNSEEGLSSGHLKHCIDIQKEEELQRIENIIDAEPAIDTIGFILSTDIDEATSMSDNFWDMDYLTIIDVKETDCELVIEV